MSFDRNVHRAQHISVPGQPRPLPNPVRTDDDLAVWQAERDMAAAQVSDLERERRRMLAGASVEQIRIHDDTLATARVRQERAAAVIEDAEQRFAAHAERERAAQPERRRLHAAALKARAEAERILREVYGPAAETIADTLAKLGELQAVIDAGRLAPEGEAPVGGYEDFRHPPVPGLHRVSLASAVVLPPVVRTEPDFWPPRR